ncbi:uncharacterized protein PGTG_08503 [Puccinia graminis f. sp. tritici CRL 75-36-700-3]|uniref:Uncharacterized protein n=1 Tax=Puccinia graminis f. sp. tritici (strain CRL 75-36-700-3 / race SCCL) TaxID=418459 RepID=E3KDY7_PUCGT|nr:uncharacterized protein PGTG_08503 [Puccinia graminis f. sp. tritici CRL 75-36-700-3]EFP82547.1 hypothetical protein PGTG_08503 [Puccinia graminis f. sp. tritici CRL 75-36-700-3]
MKAHRTEKEKLKTAREELKADRKRLAQEEKNQARKSTGTGYESSKNEDRGKNFDHKDFKNICSYLETPGHYTDLFGNGQKTSVGQAKLTKAKAFDGFAVWMNSLSPDLQLSGRRLQQRLTSYKQKYIKSKNFEEKTGAGVLDEHGPQTLAETLEDMCPCHDCIDAIFRDKPNITPMHEFDHSLASATLLPNEELTDGESSGSSSSHGLIGGLNYDPILEDLDVEMLSTTPAVLPTPSVINNPVVPAIQSDRPAIQSDPIPEKDVEMLSTTPAVINNPVVPAIQSDWAVIQSNPIPEKDQFLISYHPAQSAPCTNSIGLHSITLVAPTNAALEVLRQRASNAPEPKSKPNLATSFTQGNNQKFAMLEKQITIDQQRWNHQVAQSKLEESRANRKEKREVDLEDRRLKFEEEQFDRLQKQEEARVSGLKEVEVKKKQMVNKMLQEGRSPNEITALVRLIYG